MYSNHNNQIDHNHTYTRTNSRTKFEVYANGHASPDDHIALINRRLPRELTLRIFSFLDVVTLCRCAQVSRTWNSLALDGSNWQRVDLFDFQRDVEEHVVQNLSKKCGGFLKRLSLRGCQSVGDSALRIFAQQCRNIEDLVLDMCKRITDSTCYSLSTYSARLKVLDLSSCSQITDNSLIALSEGCHKLMHINISWCSQITTHGLKALAQGCPQIKVFIGRGCVLITDEGIQQLAKGCCNLQTLNIQSLENITDAAVRAISENCPDLKSLCLSGCSQLTDASLQALGTGCRELRTLEAAQCSQFTDHGYNTLTRGCASLERMDLEECVLSLSHCELITDEGIRLLSGGHCTTDYLEVLELDNCPLITDKALDYMTHCRILKRIDLYDCQLITRAGIRKLKSFLPDLMVHAYFAPVTPPPSTGGGRQRMCRCCTIV